MSNEWYTMPRYIAAARQVMGGIELDPASCFEANRIVGAEHYYTQADNGLLQDWTCETMWLNPPYGKQYGHSGISAFIDMLIAEYAAGRVKSAILLAMDDSSTKWFHRLADYPICFADHKVHFYTTQPTAKKPTATHMHGTIFVYFGRNEQRFIDVFSQFGPVFKRVSPKRLSTPTLFDAAAERIKAS